MMRSTSTMSWDESSSNAVEKKERKESSREIGIEMRQHLSPLQEKATTVQEKSQNDDTAVKTNKYKYKDDEKSDRNSDHRSLLSSRPTSLVDLTNEIEVLELKQGVESAETNEEIEPEEELTSNFKTFGNIFTSFIGSGILGLPYAFKKSGVLLGLGLLLVISSVSVYAMLLIIRSKNYLGSQGVKVATYGDLGSVAYGPLGRAVVNIALVLSQTGFCVAYLIFISTNIHNLYGTSKTSVVFACIPALCLLSFLKNLKALAPIALFADAANFLGLAVVYLSDFENIPWNHEQISMVHWKDLSFFFGVAVFCFEGAGMVLPLESSMREKENFMPLLMGTVGIITTLYATFGICGYLAFGELTQDVITLNMPKSTMTQIVKVSLCVGLYFTHPIMLFPVFEVLEKRRLRFIQNSHGKKIFLNTRRALIVILTGIIAAWVPNFGLFISIVGSTCCCLLAFILPALFYIKICRDLIDSSTIALLILIIFVGVSAAIVGVVDFINRIVL